MTIYGSSRWKLCLYRILDRSLVALMLLMLLCAFLASPPRGAIEANDKPNPGHSQPVLRGKNPLVIYGSAVAISQEPVIEGEASSVDLMLLKIEKVIAGNTDDSYVRADFNRHSSVKIDDERAKVQRQLLSHLLQGKVMEIHLRPPVDGVECRWTYSPPGSDREEVGVVMPVMLPVGGAKDLPDMNKLHCYAFELQDFGKITPANKEQ